MTLNKAQQQEWVILESVLQATSRVCSDINAVKDEMKLWIADFERFVNHEYKVKIINTPDLALKLVDCSRDSMKVSVDAVPSVTLRSRNESVQITVKAAYRDTYSFSNAEIAESLRTLAEKLDRLDTEVRDAAEDTDLTPSVDRTISVADEPSEAEESADIALEEGIDSDIQLPAADKSVSEIEGQEIDASIEEALEDEYGEVLLELEPAPEQD